VLDGDGTERRVPVAALRPGDRFVVRPGETIAADGAVLFGESAVDRSMMTGESVPVDVAEGDSVTAGTVAVSGRLIVGAAKVGSDTQLAHLVALVEDAQAQKAAIQRLADRISGVFVPAILVLAVLTLAGWLAAGSTGQQAFSAALAVLIIACPCALGLATPAALVVASGRGAQLGIFIKGYQALESSRSVDTVVLDKTGTVTAGVMSVTGVAQAAGTSRTHLLRYAGAVAALRRLGLRTILLTGDNQATADAVAAEAGIGEVIAGAMPASKVAVITDLQAQGRSVAMVGDGVNDGTGTKEHTASCLE
jgi:P-type E1-E2 ATPase